MNGTAIGPVPRPDDGISLSLARPEDEEDVRALLVASGLPHQDIGPHLGSFVVAREGTRLVASVGLEVVGGDVGLLRSLAVGMQKRGSGLGRLLTRVADGHARRLGLRELWLLTTTAEGFFARLGFRTVPREEVPPQVRATREFTSLCPATAVCMVAHVGQLKGGPNPGDEVPDPLPPLENDDRPDRR